MITYFINLLQNYDPIIVSALSLLIYFFIIFLFFKIWGKHGLFLFIAIAIIGANVQVLKLSYFGYLEKPVALGTELFATTYLCTDLLSEHYGHRAARQGVFIGFASMLVWTVITSLTLAFAPLTPDQAGESYAWALRTHDNMTGLFTLLPVFLVSGLGSYLISQLADISLYTWIRKVTQSRKLWLRNNLSTIVSALVDNIVFSTLAFLVLAKNPLDVNTLVFTYILGTYTIRIVIALFDTPLIYLSTRIVPRDKSDYL